MASGRRCRCTEPVWWSLVSVNGGTGAVVAGEGGLLAVLLPDPVLDRDCLIRQLRSEYPGGAGENRASLTAARELADYFAGQRIEFSVSPDLSGFTPFQAAVYRATMAIPYGETRTYGRLAAAVGRPAASRAVGGAMAANPLPVIIPCHRVVGASGALTGYSAPGGTATKARLLAMEQGACFVSCG